MKFINPYISTKIKIESLTIWVIVQSILYYEHNTSIVSDAVYDANCKQLNELIQSNTEEHERSAYYYVTFDYVPDTGFDLYYRLNKKDKKYLTEKAIHVKMLLGGR